MTETDDLAARLTALETVLRQLMTHMAVRADDPPRWLATRRTLALHALQDGVAAPDNGTHARLAELESAIAEFFAPVEGLLTDYVSPRKATSRPAMRSS